MMNLGLLVTIWNMRWENACFLYCFTLFDIIYIYIMHYFLDLWCRELLAVIDRGPQGSVVMADAHVDLMMTKNGSAWVVQVMMSCVYLGLTLVVFKKKCNLKMHLKIYDIDIWHLKTLYPSEKRLLEYRCQSEKKEPTAKGFDFEALECGNSVGNEGCWFHNTPTYRNIYHNEKQWMKYVMKCNEIYNNTQSMIRKKIKGSGSCNPLPDPNLPLDSMPFPLQWPRREEATGVKTIAAPRSARCRHTVVVNCVVGSMWHEAWCSEWMVVKLVSSGNKGLKMPLTHVGDLWLVYSHIRLRGWVLLPTRFAMDETVLLTRLHSHKEGTCWNWIRLDNGRQSNLWNYKKVPSKK